MPGQIATLPSSSKLSLGCIVTVTSCSKYNWDSVLIVTLAFGGIVVSHEFHYVRGFWSIGGQQTSIALRSKRSSEDLVAFIAQYGSFVGT